MSTDRHFWGIVLAAGEGRRLSALTADARGVSVPKQFCCFGRARPMVHWALDRARSVVADERIVTIVAEEHRGWWERELAAHPEENLIVQPRNRGTAAGILLPLISILRRDPSAVVVVLPSDHHVEDEETLSAAIVEAREAVARQPGRIALLGIALEELDPEYGWILPESDQKNGLARVDRFVEKPDPFVAAQLLAEGALCNSFVFVASARHLLHLFGQELPELLEPFLRDLVVRPREGALGELYAGIPVRDFSKDLLQRVPEHLGLVAVPACGWSDLGTPARLQRFLRPAPERAPLSA